MARSSRRAHAAAVLSLVVAMTGVAVAQDGGLLDSPGDEASRRSTIVWIGDRDAAGADRTLIRQARESGYEVRLVDDDLAVPTADSVTDEAPAQVANAAVLEDADLVVVGSTADATLVAPLRDAELPLLALAPEVYVELGLARSAAVAARPTTELRIKPGVFGHPLLAGLIYEPKILREPAALNTAAPGRGATVLAREGGSRRPTLFVYESGAPLVDGTPARAARVAFPFGGSGADALTAAGRNLFAASLAWLAEQNTVSIQIVAVNDIHGHLDGVGRVRNAEGEMLRAGGAADLGAFVAERRRANPNTLFVSGGDLIGESATLSGAGADEPTMAAFDAMTLDLAAVGPGELSRGRDELERLAATADFHFLAANLVDDTTDEAVFAAYATQSFGGVDVAVIGIVPNDIGAYLPPGTLDGLRVNDDVDTINTLVDHLKNDEGVEIVVVAISLGGRNDPASPTACIGLLGELGSLVNRSSSRVDAYITGGSHQSYVCDYTGRPVTASRPYGRTATVAELRFDRRTGILETAAENITIAATETPDENVERVLDVYRDALEPRLERVVGSVSEDITRAPNLAGETTLGYVVADARLAATADPAVAGAQIAFASPQRVRNALRVAPSEGERRGRVTFREAGAVVPFNDRLVTIGLTGSQIEAALEQQWSTRSPGVRRLLQVSDGFSYVYDPLGPIGDRVDPATITLLGVPLDPAATYRVTVDLSLIDGTVFTALRQATDPQIGPTDRDALVSYLGANRRLVNPELGRILSLSNPGG
jgi:5'-nucleotidase